MCDGVLVRERMARALANGLHELAVEEVVGLGVRVVLDVEAVERLAAVDDGPEQAAHVLAHVRVEVGEVVAVA